MEIVKGLSRNGHRINLCVPKLGGGTVKWNLKSNVKLSYIPTIPLQGIRPLSYLFFSLFYLPWLYHRLQADIIYIRDTNFTFFPVLFAKACKVPCVLEVNGLIDEIKTVGKIAAWTYYIFNAFNRWNLRKANHIITVTEGIKKEMVRQYGIDVKKISIITNGVNVKRFQPTSKIEARKKVGLSEPFKYVGFVGGFFPWHGLDQLVEAASYVLKVEPHVKFVIVGAGSMEPLLKKMISIRKLDQAFIFTGSVPFNLVPIYINSFDVCVVFFKSVRKDPGDPIKLYEYLACGRPVVASNVPGYGDVVESIGAGISVNSEDSIAVSEAILKLLKNKYLAESKGMNGFKKAQRSYNWKSKVKETEGIMMEVLSRR
jgi:glycosyltransferase involved in cell wall biosynthesis